MGHTKDTPEDSFPGARARRLVRWLYRHRRPVAMAIYACTAAASYALSFALHFEFRWREAFGHDFLLTLPLMIGVRLFWDGLFDLTAGRWRYAGLHDVYRLFGAMTCGTFSFWAIDRMASTLPDVPAAIILADWIIGAYLTAGLWIVYRTLFERGRRRRARVNGKVRRVLIAGAGEAGNRLVREMLRTPTGYWPIGFVDDDPEKKGTSLHGLKVFGPIDQMAEFAEAEGVDEIIIAMPSAPPHVLRRVVEECEGTGLPFKVLPGIAEVLAGEVRVNQLREVRIEDLLGREPVRLELSELTESLQGRSVLITGAAGSIGSELARQIASYRPGRLVLYEQAESELYFLELDLRAAHPGLQIVPVIGDILDMARLRWVFQTYRPERVFHAAAYKHVPLMEANAREAVRNNVIGTWNVARAAGEGGAEQFVLISTDKAVRPASVMGASKRAAELLVLACQERYPDCAFIAVRFGNVLGSNGSVIPLFRRQLAAGQPITITHPEVTRYFMTTAEAVQLVLQASALPGARGRIAMLDMGEPVRILDLARNLIRLAGLRPEADVRLVFTGLRPGEKLHEELAAPNESTVPTPVEKIRLIASPGLGAGSAVYLARVETLESELIDASDEAARRALIELLLFDPSIAAEELLQPGVFAGGGTPSPQGIRQVS